MFTLITLAAIGYGVDADHTAQWRVSRHHAWRERLHRADDAHHSTSDTHLSLYDGSHNFIISPYPHTGSRLISFSNRTGTTDKCVFLQTKSYQHTAGLTGTAAYTLDVTFANSIPCVADQFEDTDDATAVELPMGLTRGLSARGSDTLDWLSVDPLAGDVLHVTASFHDANGNINLYIIDTQPTSIHPSAFSVTALASSVSPTDNESISYTASYDGTDYVVANLFGEAGNTTLGGGIYGLQAAVTAAP